MKITIIKKALLINAFLFFMPCQGQSISSIINTEGYYPYGTGISAKPTDANDSIITVSASNVTINLNNYIFEQDLTSTASNFTGIFIVPGVHDVTICNGTIQNLTGTGIFVSDNCSKIVLENLTITSCGNVGISAVGTSSGVFEVGIKNCVVSEIRATNTWPISINLQNCVKVILYDLRTQGLSTTLIDESVGFLLNNVIALDMSNCKALQNSGINRSIGFLFDNCQDGMINGSLAYKNATIGGDGADKAIGFFMRDCQRISLRNCQSALNDAQFGSSIGFCCQNGQQNIFEKCFAQLNSAQSDVQGFYMAQESELQLVKCTSRSNKAVAGQATGIYLDQSSECYICNNTLVNNQGATSFGILDTLEPSSSSIIGNYAFNNGTNYSVTYTNGVVLAQLELSLSNTSQDVSGAAVVTLHNISVNP